MSTRTAGGIPDPRHAADDGGISSASADASTDGQQAVAEQEAARVARWASRDHHGWWGPRRIHRLDCPLDGVFLVELRKVLPPGRIVHLPLGCSLAHVHRPSSGAVGSELPPLPRFRALAAPRGEVDDSNASSKPSSRLRQLITAPHVIALVPLGVGLATLGATAMSAAQVKTLFADTAWTLGTLLFLLGLIVAVSVVIAETSHLVSSSIREPPTQEELAHALLRDLRHDWRRITRPDRWLRDRDLPRHLPVFVVPALPRDRDDHRGSDGPDDWGTALLRAYRRQNRWLDRSRLRFQRVCPRWLRRGWWGRLAQWLLGLVILAFCALPLAVLTWSWVALMPLTVPPIVLLLIRRSLPFRTPSALIVTDDPDIDERLLSRGARTPIGRLVRPAGRGKAAYFISRPLAGVRHIPEWIKRIPSLLRSGICRSIGILAPSQARSRPRRAAVLVVLATFAASWAVAWKLSGHPYCLGPRASLDRFTSPIADIPRLDWSGAQGPWRESDGEWIGYRTCLGWDSLPQDAVDALAGRMAAPFVPAQTRPEDEPGLFDVDRIYTENRRVEDIRQPGQPIITVALVTSLTTNPDLRNRSVVAEREGLAGAYAAQRRLNSATSPETPLVRLAVVNAGDLTGLVGTPLGDPRRADARKCAQDAAASAQDAAQDAAASAKDAAASAKDAAASAKDAAQDAAARAQDAAAQDAAARAKDAARAKVAAQDAAARATDATRAQDLAVSAQVNARAQAHVAILCTKLSALVRSRSEAPVAAIVTVNSTDATRELLDGFRDPASNGPVLFSPTMSADGFATDSLRGRFFQVGSINVDQVWLIYDHAVSEGKALSFVYPCGACSRKHRHSPPKGDSYVMSMYNDVLKLRPAPSQACASLPTAPTRPAIDTSVSLVPWSPGQLGAPDGPCNGRTKGRHTAKSLCPSGLVFFGGRYTQLGTFVQDLQRACPGDLPELAVADSGDRLLADPVLARQVPHGTQVLISSRTPLLTCDNLASVAAKPGPGAGRRADFLDDIKTYLGRCTQPVSTNENRWLINGWAGSSYDTLRMIYDAQRAGCLPVPDKCGSVPSLYGASSLAEAGHRPLGLIRVPDIAAGFGPGACIQAYLPQPKESPRTLGKPPEDACPESSTGRGSAAAHPSRPAPTGAPTPGRVDSGHRATNARA